MTTTAPSDLPVYAPADIVRRPDPIWVPGTPYLVPSFYDGRWHNDHFSEPVLYDGKPIEVNGERLTIGMVPPWRRYALEDTSGNLRPQHEFAESKRRADEEYVYEKSGHNSSLQFPENEPVPNIREFVSWKRHHLEQEKLVPLGTPTHRQKPRRADTFYDPVTQQPVPWKSLPENTRKTIVEALLETGAEVPPDDAAPSEAAGKVREAIATAKAMPMTTAACGKEVAINRVKQHSRFCKACKSVEPTVL